jgi:hypothetical protein
VARRRRPTFSFWWAGALLIACSTAAAASRDIASGYRLAGTMAVGKTFIAFLQVPDGGQVLVRAGSTIDGARVVTVTESGIRLALPAGIVDLDLQGTGKAQATPGSVVVTGASDDDKSRVYVRDVSADQLSRGLSGAPAASGEADKRVAAGTGDVAAQRIAVVLELPQGSRVLSVSGQSVTSADQAIRKIESAFASGLGVILDVQTAEGPGRVYIQRGDR